MHIIRRLAAVGDTNVRGDKTPAEPARNQIAVLHTRPPNMPRIVCIHMADHEFSGAFQQINW